MGIVRESTRLLYPRVWDLKCLAAVACFVTSNVLFLVHSVQEMANAPEGAQQPNYVSYDPLVELDPAYIEGQWSNRIASRHYLMAAAVSHGVLCALSVLEDVVLMRTARCLFSFNLRCSCSEAWPGSGSLRPWFSQRGC